MNRRQMVLAMVIAASGVGCTATPAAGPDGHLELHAALTGAARAQGCAAELWRAADLDPQETARLLALEPGALAPWGGAAHARPEIRSAILARASAAQDDARAARSLALLGEHASSEQDALRREKLARSVAASLALCGAADRARSGLLAQRR